MSRYEYERSAVIANADEPFYGIIMAAMRRADDYNLRRLIEAWPDVHTELEARYNAPGGRLQTDSREEQMQS